MSLMFSCSSALAEFTNDAGVSFLTTHDSGRDIALHMCVCASVCPSVTLFG